ncbi:hypothetical protein KI387_007621, partial [Taxus chinensis]
RSMAFKWIAEGEASFEAIKEDISQALTLVNLDFSKDFMLYAFSGGDIISAILAQQNREGLEQLVAFFSQSLEEYET